jgi:hypothetical protein
LTTGITSCDNYKQLGVRILFGWIFHAPRNELFYSQLFLLTTFSFQKNLNCKNCVRPTNKNDPKNMHFESADCGIVHKRLESMTKAVNLFHFFMPHRNDEKLLSVRRNPVQRKIHVRAVPGVLPI